MCARVCVRACSHVRAVACGTTTNSLQCVAIFSLYHEGNTTDSSPSALIARVRCLCAMTHRHRRPALSADGRYFRSSHWLPQLQSASSVRKHQGGKSFFHFPLFFGFSIKSPEGRQFYSSHWLPKLQTACSLRKHQRRTPFFISPLLFIPIKSPEVYICVCVCVCVCMI